MWVPLHLHSQYSILDGAASIEAIAKKAQEYQLPAVALTDHGNLCGAVEFYKACKEVKVKPLIGCEVYMAVGSRLEKKKKGKRTHYHLTLIAKNEEGYHNLCKLSSLGYLEGFYYHPRIDEELLQKYSKGLICLSGCLSSEASQLALEGEEEPFYAFLTRYKELFKEDYYLELQRHEMAPFHVHELEESWLQVEYETFIQRQKTCNARLLEASKRLQIPCVATNDTHYIDREDWRAHEILLNIQSGEPVELRGEKGEISLNPKRRIYPSRELYFKSPEEMAKLFADIPEAISNTLKVAEKCTFSFDFTLKHYPIYLPPTLQKEFTEKEQKASAAAYLQELCEKGIEERYTGEVLKRVEEKYPGKDPLAIVRERLKTEMDVIVSKEMCDYLLIVWDFIFWAKENRIPMGPGRGSGAGSIILYLIGITDIEPLSLHLFFERFINPERISYPDIDVDICMSRREEVIDYTVRKYGKENVAQITTFGTMKARMTIKDVGRVLSVPLSKVNIIASFVPEDPTMTLEKALEMDVDLNRMYLEDEDAKKIIDLGLKIEGSIRNIGIHAAGIIICKDPLMDQVPIMLAKENKMVSTQYSMKPLELVGMLKIDFLGLKTLTSIQHAVDAISKNHGVTIDWVHLPLQDDLTYALLQQGKTLGIFQMESGGMKELSLKLQPDKFEEIIAIGALYRPGPMDMIPSFIQRKHGKEKIEYDHPLIEPILAETYGIMVYQEQVMHIATKLASYSLGEGDVLRRAMGKKDRAQMEKERAKFLKGASENGIAAEVSSQIFDKMEKFAAYGFNKSHAAAYGYLTYVTAYLKAHYPKEWMAALLTCDKDDVEKVAKYIRECQAMAIPILPPDINEAQKDFVATKGGIRFAMGAIKGIGEGVVEAIIEERAKGGAFLSFPQFFKRVTLKRIGKKGLELLVEAGAFDFTGHSRESLKVCVEPFYERAVKEQEESAKGVISFFSLLPEQEESFTIPVVPALSKKELLKREKELLGFFLSSHPLKEYETKREELGLKLLSSLSSGKIERVFFLIESIKIKISTKSQRKFAILMVSDGEETIELPIWSDLYEEKAGLLEENRVVVALLQREKKEGAIRVNCSYLEDIESVTKESIVEAEEKALSKRAMKKTLSPTPKELLAPFVIEAQLDKLKMSSLYALKKLILSHGGLTPLHLHFISAGKRVAIIEVDGRLGITPSPIFHEELQNIEGFCII